jgi:hypothetical protein
MPSGQGVFRFGSNLVIGLILLVIESARKLVVSDEIKGTREELPSVEGVDDEHWAR